MISRRTMLAAGAVAPLMTPAVAAGQQPTPPTIEELCREPVLTDINISPNGQTIGVVHRIKRENRDGHDVSIGRLAIHKVDDLDNPQYVELNGTAHDIFWVNDNTMAMLFAPPGMRYQMQGNRRVIVSKSINFRDLDVLFVSRDGTIRKLSDFGPVKRNALAFLDFVEKGSEDGQTVLVKMLPSGQGLGAAPALYSLNVVEETLERLDRGQYGTDDWFTQDGKPMVRTDIDGKQMRVYAKLEEGSDWKLVRNISYREFQKPDFDLVAADKTPGVMLVATTPEGAATRGLYRYDLKTLKVGDLVSARAGRDVEGCILDRHGDLVAATYIDDRVNYEFVDKSLAPFFQEINAAFHNVNNVEIVGVSDDRKRFVLRVSGAIEAGQFVYFDREKGGVGFLGDQFPWLTPNRLAQTHATDVTSRDKSRFRAYLSVPNGPGAKRPLVIMPHGGPEVRDSLSFDPWVQALAAQGWVVVQPNFRGSGGYGKAFAEAGHRQWNGRIMEDIEDATDLLIASGLIDPKKVALMGASFGGYASLMAAARSPERYCGVVSFAGVSDLERMLRYEREIGGEEHEISQFWVKRIGAPGSKEVADASPLNHAARYRAPVLLLHGKLDRTVPVGQSRLMDEALRKAGKRCEFIEMEEHAHGGFDAEVMEAFLSKTTSFLKDCFDKAG